MKDRSARRKKRRREPGVMTARQAGITCTAYNDGKKLCGAPAEFYNNRQGYVCSSHNKFPWLSAKLSDQSIPRSIKRTAHSSNGERLEPPVAPPARRKYFMAAELGIVCTRGTADGESGKPVEFFDPELAREGEDYLVCCEHHRSPSAQRLLVEKEPAAAA